MGVKCGSLPLSFHCKNVFYAWYCALVVMDSRPKMRLDYHILLDLVRQGEANMIYLNNCMKVGYKCDCLHTVDDLNII